jgi:hypothetical protein
MTTSATVRVGIEQGARKAFAWALDWPGWCRSGRNEAGALEAFEAYAERYAVITRTAHVPFEAAVRADVVERVPGSSGTDFGVPGHISSSDRLAVPEQEAERLSRLLEAAWTVFDQTVDSAPAELRKGPRGGGRDRDKVAVHVLEADAAYAREIGLRLPAPEWRDREAVDALRGQMLDVLRRPSDGEPLAGRKWPLRYAARRIAWHAVDHAWEIQDRSET